MRALHLLAPILAGLAGCSFDGRPDGARFACGAADPCPDGLSCVGGFCQGALDAGGGVDSGTADPGECGTVSLVADDFEDGVDSAALSRWRDGEDTTVSETGGQLRVQFDGLGEPVWGGVRSVPSYRLRGGEIRVEVDQAGGQYAVLELRERGGPKAQIVVEGGTELRATILDAPGGTPEVSEIYDPDAHRFWRMRELEGDLRFETARDAASGEWHLVASMPAPFESDLVELVLSGAGRVGDPEVRFGSVNAGVVPPARYCPAADLVDDFAGPPFEPSWTSWENQGCSVAEVAGAFEVSFAVDGSVWCGIDSVELYALDTSSITAAVAAPDSPGSPVVVGVWAYELGESDALVHMIRRDSSIVFRTQGAGASQESSAPWSDQTRYFRLRGGAGGRIHGDTSPDGASWTEQFVEEAPFDLAAVQVSLQGGLSDGGVAGGDTARILGINAL